MPMESQMVRWERPRSRIGRAGRLARSIWRWAYQVPMRNRMKLARRAATPNQPMAFCPKGRMMKAAMSGPMAEPRLPPT